MTLDARTQIRRAAAADHPSIGELLTLAYGLVMQRMPATDAEAFRRSLPAAITRYAATGTWLLAELNDRPAGAVAFFPPLATRHPLFQGNVAHIQLLGVAPTNGRVGIARGLMAQCLSMAKASGASELLLQTSQYMVEARDLYQRLGFTVQRELQQVWGAPTYLYAKTCDVERAAPGRAQDCG